MTDYVAELTCRRCGTKRYVHKWALRFTHWICFTRDAMGRHCRTDNEWRP